MLRRAKADNPAHHIWLASVPFLFSLQRSSMDVTALKIPWRVVTSFFSNLWKPRARCSSVYSLLCNTYTIHCI